LLDRIPIEEKLEKRRAGIGNMRQLTTILLPIV